MNPFKFGTVVDEPFFINRKDELAKISSFIKSENHLILISPRRYGKTSLIKKVLKESGHAYLFLDMQLVMSAEDLAAQLLKRVYRISPFNKLKAFIKSFRIIPVVTINPVTGETDISFRHEQDGMVPLEDVMNLIDKLGKEKNRIVVALDEFQEIFKIDKRLVSVLRSIMQEHKHVNYVFSGSSESIIREIFENKKSPFYHFAYLMTLNMIPEKEFSSFIEDRFRGITKFEKSISSAILSETGSHPYYTQQLAFTVWELHTRLGYTEDITQKAVNEIIQNHDNDYERLWNGFNRTDMKVLIGLAGSELAPLSDEFSRNFNPGTKSTVFSSIQRLIRRGLVIKRDSTYIIDDPFFSKWILIRRMR